VSQAAPASDPRAAAAERALAELGFPAARVRVEGPDDEIAVIALPDDRWSDLLGDPRAAAVAGVRAVGFRYVALDLQPAPPPA
jgi:PP-loop superfamily ATP-utilizing enzyme